MTSNDHLDGFLSSYTSFNSWLIRRRYRCLGKYFVGHSCLDMGVADGAGVSELMASFQEVTIVDGSALALTQIKLQHPDHRVQTIHSKFEELNLGSQKFDTIIMGHVMEHLDDPVAVLRDVSRQLNTGGNIIIDVPNANSLHRQVGVQMGLIDDITSLNDSDLSIGHKRVYTLESFRSDVEAAGLNVTMCGGMMIKTLSNQQSEAVFTPDQLEAMFVVGEANPLVAAEIFIVAS